MAAHSGSPEGADQTLRVFRSRRETRAFYDRISRIYDIMAERSEAPVRAAGLERLDAKPGERMLEIGFGTGHCLASMAAATGREGAVYGIDLSEGMLKMTRGTLRRNKMSGRVGLVCGDAARLPFRGAVLDGIFMSFTLELFDNPEIPEVLAECRRVLRPGGRIAVVGMSKEGQGSRLVRAYEWTHRRFPSLVDCRPVFVRRSLEAAGFRILSSEMRKMWIPVEIVLAAQIGADRGRTNTTI
ncbi:MAG: methyltransferase domain-containing protein [Acidobacteriota bacterium]